MYNPNPQSKSGESATAPSANADAQPWLKIAEELKAATTDLETTTENTERSAEYSNEELSEALDEIAAGAAIEEQLAAEEPTDHQVESQQAPEHLSDFAVIQSAMDDLTYDLLQHTDEQETNSYREKVHRLGVFQEAYRTIAIAEPDEDEPSANELFKKIADGYFKQSENFFKESDKLTNSAKPEDHAIAKRLDLEAQGAAWRAEIAAEMANGDYDKIKSAYTAKASQDTQPESSTAPDIVPNDALTA